MKAVLIIVILAVLGIWYSTSQREPEFIIDELPPETVLAAPDISEPPVQKNYNGATFRFDDVNIKPVAEFSLTARVLSTRKYSDKDSKYSNTDLALAWGRMADDEILSAFTFSQSNRFFRWRTEGKMPIPREEITRSATNIHVIPSDKSIQNQIDDISKDDTVELKGKLVNLSRDDGFYWNSSTTRNDSGNGACEVFFVESVEILY